jgi:NADPH:quinone reductase-like Zn-dependent oxidoreductase
MKAYLLRAYGSPDNLALTDTDTPVPGEGEVLVRVRATSINPWDWHNLRGEPYIARLMAGTVTLRRPAISVLGCDMAGQVDAVGPKVTGVHPGDNVYALLPKGGGFAEYVRVPADLLAPMPASLSYEQAAAVPMAGLTALVTLRDNGQLQPGQRVLVNGAAGGVGTFTVQIAHALGATVTGVCSTRNVELVRSIGADEVIDYRTEDFTRAAGRYDLVVDIAGSRPVSACLRVLTPKGSYVMVGGQAGRWVQPAGHAIAAMATKPFVSRRITVTNLEGRTDLRDLLATLSGLIDDGKVVPVIDRRYPFEEVSQAIRYQEQGHAPGKVVVPVGGA